MMNPDMTIVLTITRMIRFRGTVKNAVRVLRAVSLEKQDRHLTNLIKM